MSSRGLPGPVGWAAEFAWRSDNTKALWNGTCGQISLSVALSAAKGWDCSVYALQRLMDKMTRDMISIGIAQSNGAATLAALATEANRQSGSIFHQQNYWENMPFSVWHDGDVGIDKWAGYKPIVMQVANGQALRDSVSGVQDEKGLQYHALSIVGADPVKGFIVADGDSPLANQRFVYYTRDTLIAARPCGLLILNMQRPAPMPPVPAPVVVAPAPVLPPAPTPAPVASFTPPSGWADDGTTLLGAPAPDGQRYPVVLGFRVLVGRGWDATNVPLQAEHATSYGSSQLFLTCETRFYSDSGRVTAIPLGPQLLSMMTAADSTAQKLKAAFDAA